MLCLAVGLAVAMLCFFHIYLVLTAQTTIEFHGKLVRVRTCFVYVDVISDHITNETLPQGNLTNARRARKAGKRWKNPYSLGPLRNFQQVYGSKLHPVLAILIPSSREPEFLPIPLLGDQGKRSTYASKAAEGKTRSLGTVQV
jgi:palmitoyltransferase